jgi:general secretion pathway protein G
MISFKNLKTRLSQDRSGFTIVELLIVIVVIAILAGLVIVTYSGIQQRARDTERKTDLKAVQGHLERYWADNAKYPLLADMNDTTFRQANFQGLPSEAFADPKNAGSQQLCGSASTSCYGYALLPAGCDNASGGDCTNYTLSAILEKDGSTYTLKSNN